ncbi:hypothetical protein C0Q70_01421 [Pomacea canaliculata]|uniref:Uncharacterized protein n=1 Tax=Pomacea canaliculata TaxID=400727 RepID=A0A2T7PZF8_POMCA|nr:hypothetical protein C0Q70_01421 [Pomacea canaliculata]
MLGCVPRIDGWVVTSAPSTQLGGGHFMASLGLWYHGSQEAITKLLIKCESEAPRCLSSTPKRRRAQGREIMVVTTRTTTMIMKCALLDLVFMSPNVHCSLLRVLGLTRVQVEGYVDFTFSSTCRRLVDEEKQQHGDAYSRAAAIKARYALRFAPTCSWRPSTFSSCCRSIYVVAT